MKVQIVGAGVTTLLTVGADNIIIKGLSVTGATYGLIADYSTTSPIIQCNYFGLAPDGSAAGNSSTGVIIRSSDALIGGLSAGQGNVFGSNNWGILTQAASNITIQGNFIGTDPTGLAARPNTLGGLGNFSGTSTINEIRNNLISGNGNGFAFQADDTWTGVGVADGVIAGNYIGTDRTGNAALANTGDGVSFTQGTVSDLVIGGTSAADRNIISGNGNQGINITSQSDITVLGNYIGVGADGSTVVGNSVSGVFMSDATNISIGDGTASGRNVIAGNGWREFQTLGTVTNLSVAGNYFATDASGNTNVSVANDTVKFVNVNTLSFLDNVVGGSVRETLEFWGSASSDGLTIQGNSFGVGANGSSIIAKGNATYAQILFGNGYSAANVKIGGSNAGEGNIIANYPGRGIQIREDAGAMSGEIVGNSIYNNSFNGIQLGTDSTQFAIYANSIHANGGIGIDIGSDGVTANDSGDTDTGPNDLLNYPLINFVSASGTTLSYDLDLDVPANTDGYRIEFFANSAPDATNGEGEIFLGFFDTGNHAGGNVTYNGSLIASQAVSVGTIISATTTRKTATSFDITSEFSVNKAVASALVVTNTNDSGAGSLRDAITYANANAAEDDIILAIPGAGPHRITLTSRLDVTDDGISIDGSSQSGTVCRDLWGGSGHTLQVIVDANSAVIDIFFVSASNVSLRGLSIVGAGSTKSGVFTHSSSGLNLTCSYLGVEPDGTVNANGYGVAMRAASTTIGGPTAGDGNVISNSRHGGIIGYNGASGLSAQNNFIGTNPTGIVAQANGDYGIGNYTDTGSTGNTTINALRDNLISGNTGPGIAFNSDNPVSGASGDVVIAGNYIGTDRTGNTALANGGGGIEFGTGSISGVTIGGTATADRNVISGNTGDGIEFGEIGDVTILSNYIGLGADGTTLVGNSARGIQMTGATDVMIGNGVASGRNVLSGNGSAEIWVQTSDNIQVDGNYFGTGLTGNISLSIESGDFINVYTVDTMAITANVFAQTNQESIEFWTGHTGTDITLQGNKFGVGADGITAFSTGRATYGQILFGSNYAASGLKIGGTGLGEGNLIANGVGAGITIASDSGVITGEITGNIIRDNGTDGIQILDADSRLAVFANAIYDNVGLGIDLGTNGVTANDNNDVDSGPNDLLNFPVINSFSGASTTLSYDVDLNVPAGDYRIDFYKNTTADPTGYGEGETHLGFIELTHAGGTQTHTGNFTGLDSLDQGEAVTATTTRKTGPGAYDITSEFSLNYTSDAATELTASKSVDVFDPTSAGLYALPGNDIISSMTVTNVGNSAADTDSIVIIDAVPGEMTFYNGDMDDGGPATGSVYFSQTGGANLTFTSAADAAFSNSASRPADMAGCTYTPSAGYDANVTYVCFNPKGAMSSGNPDPTFTLQFRARIK